MGEDRKSQLVVRNLRTLFPIRGGVFRKIVGHVRAVDDVSFEVYRGETLGIVGESGCGKTTLGRTLCKLIEPSSGQIHFIGQDITALKGRGLLKFREEIQMIFQDPYGSLNPRLTVRQILEEPLKIHRKLSAEERLEKIKAIMIEVGLSPDQIYRFPHQFSGGQRQRIGIARSLMLNPSLIICDEAVSALDVSVQSQILNLLKSLQKKEELTYVFISHDLSVVRYLTDRVAIMYLGKIVEIAETDDFFKDPKHPYSQGLLASIPLPDPRLRKKITPLEGDIPSPSAPPKGCRFNTRCPKAMPQCYTDEPILREVSGARVACHLFEKES